MPVTSAQTASERFQEESRAKTPVFPRKRHRQAHSKRPCPPWAYSSATLGPSKGLLLVRAPQITPRLWLFRETELNEQSQACSLGLRRMWADGATKASWSCSCIGQRQLGGALEGSPGLLSPRGHSYCDGKMPSPHQSGLDQGGEV